MSGLRLALAALCLMLAGPGLARAETVTVFAASSLKTALEEIAAGFGAETGDQVRLSFAGSSAMARQIMAGAPADLFLSANPGWMDAVEAEGLLVAGTRRDLLGNALVLIGAPGGPEVGLGDDLAAVLGDDRLAMALFEAVPAGIYGKAALEALGQWEALAPHVAQAENVRAALALVATGAAPLGIVYRSDAQAEPRVRVLDTFAADTHPPITYPVARIAGRETPAADAFLAYLGGEAARAVFTRHGFDVIGE